MFNTSYVVGMWDIAILSPGTNLLYTNFCVKYFIIHPPGLVKHSFMTMDSLDRQLPTRTSWTQLRVLQHNTSWCVTVLNAYPAPHLCIIKCKPV